MEGLFSSPGGAEDEEEVEVMEMVERGRGGAWLLRLRRRVLVMKAGRGMRRNKGGMWRKGP